MSLWLSELPTQTLQQTLKALPRGLMRFKQHKDGMVRFKARGDGDFNEANACIRIPKIGFVRYRKSRNISIEAGRWYVSV